MGYHPGIYHTWADCLKEVKGFKKATCNLISLFSSKCQRTNHMVLVKSFSTLTDAERFLAGENPAQGGGLLSSPSPKYYAVKNGRIPGIYVDWPSAQEQITGWTKPRHKCFATRIEAQRFLDEDEPKTDSLDIVHADNEVFTSFYGSEIFDETSAKPLGSKKTKRASNGNNRDAKSAMMEYNERDYEPGTGPLLPGAEDGFDPNIILDPETGQIVYKTIEQRQATKPQGNSGAQTNMLRIHTDGSSLGNGSLGACAGVGVYFGPNDKR